MVSTEYKNFAEIMRNATKNKVKLDPFSERLFDEKIPHYGYLSDGVIVETEKIGGVPCEILSLKNEKMEKDTAIVFFHGGGFTSGSSISTRNFASELCLRSKCKVISANYSLAPEHKFPKGLDDCFNVFKKVRETHKKVYQVGASAGGNLSLAMHHKLIDEHVKVADKIAVLSPATFLDQEIGSHISRKKRDPMLGINDYTKQKLEFYLDEKTDPSHKYISPLNGDLRKFPPTFVCVGTEEIMYDDSIFFVEKARQQGVNVELLIGEGYMHIFPCFFRDFPEVTPYFDDLISFLVGED